MNLPRSFRATATALTAVALTVALAAAPASARTTPGNISLKVTAVCSSPGDSIRSFEVWTPEKGNKVVTPASGTKEATIDFGTMNKTVAGNTFFNWKFTCRLDGATGSHQKSYGGNLFQTAYSYRITDFYGRLTMP